MSSSNYYRSWIDRPHLDPNTRLLTEEYQRGITEFMGLVQRQPEAETGMLRCPCSNCKNRKIIKEWDVWTHLYLNGFTRSYKIWYHHGETDYEYGSTSEPQPAVRLEEPIRMDVDYGVVEARPRYWRSRQLVDLSHCLDLSWLPSRCGHRGGFKAKVRTDVIYSTFFHSRLKIISCRSTSTLFSIRRSKANQGHKEFDTSSCGGHKEFDTSSSTMR
ncbi:hypothetical protein F2Q70_00002852 [Brassica cretica]|uniref:Transposase-associated domain-containing protein n=1 Tax=Brassica cretica TaxID=69181 RepID=A0A8S9IQ63_BRACR|nr:hypothetical protein F2Q70_00002852 [Brassica cretica]